MTTMTATSFQTSKKDEFLFISEIFIFPHTDAIYASLYVKGCYFGKLCMDSGLVSAVLASALLAKLILRIGEVTMSLDT